MVWLPGFGIRETEGEWLVLLSTLCDLIGMAQVHYRLRSSFLYLDEGSQQVQSAICLRYVCIDLRHIWY